MFGPLYQHYSALLALPSLRLDILAVANIMLDPTLVTALMLQSRMTYVDFIRCQTSEALQDDVLSRTPTSNDLAQSSVRQFVLHMFGTEHQSSWYLLALFPDAHLLYVESQDPTCGFLSPDPTLWSRLHVMHRLEYIHLEGIDWEIQDLVNWLQDCALRGSLRVTHFKLRSPWSIDPDPIMSLLRVLHTASAPIRVLVLDGIAKAPVDLFIAIAQLLPQLEGLTLIRRDTERQSKKRLCRCDCPTYEYAACLRSAPTALLWSQLLLGHPRTQPHRDPAIRVRLRRVETRAAHRRLHV